MFATRTGLVAKPSLQKIVNLLFMYFDTHAHLNFAAFVKDRDRVAKKCLKQQVWMINVGSNFFTSAIAVDFARKFDKGVYAAVGLHPINLGIEDSRKVSEAEILSKESPFEKEFDYESYKNLVLGKNLDSSGIEKLAKNQKVVAIGEVGLDYFYKPKAKEKLKGFKLSQELLFLQELKLSKELDLPLIIHCRMAHSELLNILHAQEGVYHQKFKGVIHCFTGNVTQLKEYLDLGFYIGFNGIIFKLNLKDVIKKVPLDKLLLETDCPYLSPPEYNQKRNDPMGVKYVAKEIARIKKIPLEELADQTTKNAQQLFLNVNY